MHLMFQRCGITPAEVLGLEPNRLNRRAHAAFLIASEQIAREEGAP